MAVVVLAIWLVGAAVTKYSLEQMAFVTPIAVVVVGATVGIVLLWVKVVTDSLRRRASASSHAPTASDRVRTVTVRDELVDDRTRRRPRGGLARARARRERDNGVRPRPAWVRRRPRRRGGSSTPALPGHDPFLLGDMAGAVERIRAAVDAGTRICVHGDYDVDGICATALAVLFLRELGADVDWHLPSRFEEGYGVSRETLGRLADDGVGLLADGRLRDHGRRGGRRGEATRARGRRHRPPPAGRDAARLPDRGDTAVELSRFPSSAARASSTSSARRSSARSTRPFAGISISSRWRRSPTSSRSSTRTARSRRRVSARSPRRGGPGSRRSCGAPASILRPSTRARWASGSLRASTRLGGSAGPMSRSSSCSRTTPTRPGGMPTTLEELNRDRQAVEDRILREATAAVDEMPEPRRRRRGYVLWNEDWHEGVIGIVASRLVERFHRPVVLITRSQDAWKGSGRSIRVVRPPRRARRRAPRTSSGSAVTARQPASRSTESNLEAFADDFRGARRRAPRRRTTCSRSCGSTQSCSARDLTLDLAEELARLAPFGLGNPEPTLLVPATEAVAPATVGEGKHLRFRVRQHGRDAGSAIAFGQGTQIDRLRAAGRFDVAFRLKENHWNGTVAPQLVVRRVFDTPEGYEELRASLAELWRRGESAWTPEARRDLRRARAARGGRTAPSAARVRVVQSTPPRSGAAARGVRLPQPRPGRDGTSASRIDEREAARVATAPPASETDHGMSRVRDHAPRLLPACTEPETALSTLIS